MQASPITPCQCVHPDDFRSPGETEERTINLSGEVQGGGTPVLQWGFDETTGAVTVPVNDDSGTGNHGTNLLFGAAPTHSADIPDASVRQSTTGVGSVDFTGTNAAISSADSAGVGSGQGILSAAQVVAAGGLTLEVWVKNPGTTVTGPGGVAVGSALGMGAMYRLGYEPRVSLGTLTPAEFTVVAPPPGIFAQGASATSNGENVFLQVKVQNSAATGRALTTPTFSGPGAAFFCVANFSNTLAPGALNVPIDVDFDAEASGAGVFTATMTIHSDDPNRPAYEVPLKVEVFGGYTSWANANAPGQPMDQDHDNDGVPNGIEYFMGESGSGFTAMPVPDATGAITWTKGAGYTGTYGADYRLETSGNLVTWDAVPQASVNILAGSIGYTLPLDGPGKFVRLVVTRP